MYTVLAVIGGFLGLIVTGAAFYTVWLIMDRRKSSKINNDGSDVLRTWTAMDYAAIGVFIIGFMLLVADLFAVIRDRDSYPYYHYGYLFCAIIFVLVGMMFMVIRLGVNLRSAPRSPSTLLDEGNKPDKADETNNRIEG